ncbi:MAG: cytochrome c [Acidobacteria bacterium]|nr:cytochrome c [Acidobacteriota bacterium]
MARVTLNAGEPGRRDVALLAVLAVLLVGATAWLVYREAVPEYRDHQRQFGNLVQRRLGDAAATAVPAGIQQLWVPGAGRADRCPSCHLATAWRGFERGDEPLRTHPAGMLRAHPTNRFGCTLCHGGQGWAVDRERAHGHVPYWPEPLADASMAASLLPGAGRASLMALNCNACHRYETATAGAEIINRGKRLVDEKGCRACHRINGRGGLIGPDLSWAGDKNPEQYDYGRLSGRRSVFTWHEAHFQDPRALVAETVMPSFHLPPDDIKALALLVMSWRRVGVDASLLGDLPRTDSPSPQERALAAEMERGPGAWFVKTGCYQCHPVSVFGVKSPTPIGPDLSTAMDDVERRFSVPVDTFVKNPSGTMKAVFARQFMLSPAQKDEAVRELRAAYAEFQRQQAVMPAAPARAK